MMQVENKLELGVEHLRIGPLEHAQKSPLISSVTGSKSMS